MARQLTNKSKSVTFFCTSCSNKYELISGHKEDLINIDICANCHPFYQGKQQYAASLGPAEKLKDKFARGKEYSKVK